MRVGYPLFVDEYGEAVITDKTLVAYGIKPDDVLQMVRKGSKLRGRIDAMNRDLSVVMRYRRLRGERSDTL